MNVEFAELTMADYAETIRFWRETEGMGLSKADEPERIAAYLERNPGMSFTARDGNELVGAVLAGHDGRRGYLHHLAVRPDHRGRGIGKGLVERCLESLRMAGIDKCHLFVYHDNLEGIAFWRKTGWVERVELVLMSRNI
jgi:N-acetylglutamate synthase